MTKHSSLDDLVLLLNRLFAVLYFQELDRQGEQLNNVEHKLDCINQDMKTTQKHLNNIKSIFGGIKNWWGGKKDGQVPEKPKRESKLQDTLDPSYSSQSDREHPALRLKSEDQQGLYDRPQVQTSGRTDSWQTYEAKLDENLGMLLVLNVHSNLTSLQACSFCLLLKDLIY